MLRNSWTSGSRSWRLARTTLSEVRRIIRDADPDILEEWKWVKTTNPGVPVWSHNGGICTGETYKNAVNLKYRADEASGA